MKKTLPPLNIGDLKIMIPIIQGGMGVQISKAELAAAVADCGAAGTIYGVGLGYGTPENETDFVKASRDGLIREIKKARKLSRGVIGVNLMVATSNFDDLAKTAVEEKTDFLAMGAGLPLDAPKYDERKTIKLIPIVSSVRAAVIILRRWKKRYNRLPDAFIVEGPLAGGHLGFKAEELPKLNPDHLKIITKDMVSLGAEYKIPIIPAGGIFDGRDIAQYLNMGANGVQMATRFVTTDECPISDKVKELYVKAQKKDLVIINSPVGMPGRAIKTQLIETILLGKKTKFECHYHCLSTCNPETTLYCIAECMFKATTGDIENSVIFAGSNVIKIREITSVKNLIMSLIKETKKYMH